MKQKKEEEEENLHNYPAKISVKLKLLYLRAQEELDGLLVVSPIQK